MFRPDEVRSHFPAGVFGSAATQNVINEAERLLGHKLPRQLLDLYLDFDGFLGPTNAPFLLPLLERPRPGGESLVSYTLFFRSEDYFPRWLQQAIVVGDSGTGAAWFMLMNEAGKLVQWDAEWEEYEPMEGSLLDAWGKEKRIYDSFQPFA